MFLQFEGGSVYATITSFNDICVGFCSNICGKDSIKVSYPPVGVRSEI